MRFQAAESGVKQAEIPVETPVDSSRFAYSGASP
jgi:hypothetical protein